MRGRVNLYLQVVSRDGKGVAVKSMHRQRTQHTKKEKKFQVSSFKFQAIPVLYDYALRPHFCLARLCRTISYSTTPAATETFSEGTLPSMGMETTKSHLRRTRSCNPLPSAPRT